MAFYTIERRMFRLHIITAMITSLFPSRSIRSDLRTYQSLDSLFHYFQKADIYVHECLVIHFHPSSAEGWISPTGPIFKEDNDILVHRCLKVDSPWIVHLKFWSKAPVLRQYLMTSCRSLNSNSCILDKG